MNAYFTAITILTSVIGVATPTLAAKPQPPSPPPTPGNTSCNEVTGVGVFPAMVYSKIRYKVIKRGGGKTVYDGTDAFLADSNGMCSIWIGSNAIYDYRQIGVEARVAFEDNDAIKVLKFNVVDSDSDSDSDSIGPITSTTVYVGPATSYGVNDIELSKDGNTIYFIDEFCGDGYCQDTFKSIDIGACNSNCPPDVLFTFPLNVGVSGLSINDADNRLYMSIHDRDPDIRTISLLQKDDQGVWGSLRHVVKKELGSYEDVSGFARTALGRWEHKVAPAISGVRDVLAFIVERASGNTTDIIDVTDCDAAAPAPYAPSGTCLTTGESFVVTPGIGGYATSFTSIPAGSNASGTSPSLLVSNYTVIEIELSSNPMVTRPLPIEGVADSAD